MIIETQEKDELPYNFSTDILMMLVDELCSTGKEGITINELFSNIGKGSMGGKSYVINALEFFDLGKTDGKKIYRTDLCRNISFQRGKKSQLLAENLPAKYIKILKWIKHSATQSMNPSELKIQYANETDYKKSDKTLDRSISTFLAYTKNLGLLLRSGSGPSTSYELTEFGKKIITGNSGQVIEKDNSSSSKEETKPITKMETQDGYWIRMETPDRTPIMIDVHTEADWIAISSILNAWKENWKNKHEEKNKNKK